MDFDILQLAELLNPRKNSDSDSDGDEKYESKQKDKGNNFRNSKFMQQVSTVHMFYD